MNTICPIGYRSSSFSISTCTAPQNVASVRSAWLPKGASPWEVDQYTLNPWEIFESLLDPTPDVIAIRDDQDGWHYLDLVTLKYCNADIEDPEIVQEYIGSSAEVTNRVQEEIARLNEAYDNWIQWLSERK